MLHLKWLERGGGVGAMGWRDIGEGGIGVPFSGSCSTQKRPSCI